MTDKSVPLMAGGASGVIFMMTAFLPFTISPVPGVSSCHGLVIWVRRRLINTVSSGRN